jgi:hypothetical protein
MWSIRRKTMMGDNAVRRVKVEPTYDREGNKNTDVEMLTDDPNGDHDLVPVKGYKVLTNEKWKEVAYALDVCDDLGSYRDLLKEIGGYYDG